MELGQLEAFVQVAKLCSFTEAAKALFLTQPSVTARIQALERELGEDLFERTGRAVRITEAGATFLFHAEHALKSVQEGRDALAALRDATIGTLRIGSAPTISTYVLPQILKAFRTHYPSIGVSVRSGRSDQIMRMVLADEVQIGLVRALAHPELETVPLYNDEVVLITDPGHPFAAEGHASLEAVADQSLIFFDQGSSYYGLIHGYFRDAALVPAHTMELDSIEATKKMVEQGLGIAMLPRVSVERELGLGLLVEVAITGTPPLERPIALIYRRSRKQARTVTAYLELLATLYHWPSSPSRNRSLSEPACPEKARARNAGE